MSGYPLVLHGAAINALVVGGGPVALRKASALLDAGADVRVVAPMISAELVKRAADEAKLHVIYEAYVPEHIAGATVVIAATDDAAVNAAVAVDARARGCLVNVAGAPELGSFVTPAVHRAGRVIVAVTTGGVPSAAARVRDAIAQRFDDRFASAIGALAELRTELLARGERERWTAAIGALVGDDFCECVESGAFSARVAEWR